jgi:hypothetical protein
LLERKGSIASMLDFAQHEASRRLTSPTRPSDPKNPQHQRLAVSAIFLNDLVHVVLVEALGNQRHQISSLEA